MNRSLIMLILVAIILTLVLPLTLYVFKSEEAFTRDNLIIVRTADLGQ